MPHRLLKNAKVGRMLSSNLTSSSARATYAAAAAVAWPAHQSCEDFSVSPRATIHESPVPAKAVAAHGGSAYAPSFTSDPQLLHTTPIIAPTTSKMNSGPDEQAGVAHDQVRSLDTGISSALPTPTLQAPSSPISVNNDSAHSSETCRSESPILIEDSEEEPADEHADEPEEDAALQDRPEQNSAVVVRVGGARSARHVMDLTEDRELDEDAPRPMYEEQRFRHFYRVRGGRDLLDFRYQPSFVYCVHLGKVATGSVASIGLAVIRPPVYAKWFPEYLVVGKLSSTNRLSIRVVRRDRKGKLLPNWPGGGTFFPDSAVVKEFGYFFPSILQELAEDTDPHAIGLNKLRAQLQAQKAGRHRASRGAVNRPHLLSAGVSRDSPLMIE
jgi:hypothetical protein